jgi:hypothetical protein
MAQLHGRFKRIGIDANDGGKRNGLGGPYHINLLTLDQRQPNSEQSPPELIRQTEKNMPFMTSNDSLGNG